MPDKIDPISKMEPQTSLYGNTSNSTASDHQFEEQLKTEEERLKGKSLFFAPGGPLAMLFNSFIYDYDDSLTLSKIEKDFEKPQSHEPPRTQKQNELKSATNLKQENMAALPSSPTQSYKLDPRLFQEILGRSLGLLYAPSFLLSLNEKPVFITKTDLQAIIDELVEKVSLVKENQSTRLQLALKPDELGEMLLTVSNQNGLISIQIDASQQAKKLLDDNLAALSAALRNAALNIGNISVSVGGSYAFSRAPEMFSDLSTKISQTLLENNSQNMLNLAPELAIRRLSLNQHLIDWEA